MSEGGREGRRGGEGGRGGREWENGMERKKHDGGKDESRKMVAGEKGMKENDQQITSELTSSISLTMEPRAAKKEGRLTRRLSIVSVGAKKSCSVR